jgi:hypothetical protein
MNAAQKWIGFLWAVAVILLCLFPPWITEAGYDRITGSDGSDKIVPDRL